MRKIFLTTIAFIGMTFSVNAQSLLPDFGWHLNLFGNDKPKEEEAGVEFFQGNNNPWDDLAEPQFNIASPRKGGGLFGLGSSPTSGVGSGFRSAGSLFGLPNNHGALGDQNAPLGSGIIVLTALGSAYLIGKRRKDE